MVMLQFQRQSEKQPHNGLVEFCCFFSVCRISVEKHSQKQFSAFFPFTAYLLSILWITVAQNEYLIDLLESPIISATEVTLLVPALACGAFI